MRIVFLTPFPSIGGGHRVIGIYAAGLQALGHDVTVVSACKSTAVGKSTIKRFIRSGRLSEESRISDSFVNPKFRHMYSANSNAILASDVPECDAIIATWWETANWLNDFEHKPERLFYFMQDYGVGGMEMDRLIPTWFLPYKIITIAPWMKRLIRACNPGKDVTVIENGVDSIFAVDQYREDMPPVVFGHVFSNFETKGTRYVIEAFGKLRETVPEAKLLCFGGDRPRSLDIPGLEFHYNINSSELLSIYSKCRSWIFSSRAEGFGLPILEAFAAGTPVIATPVGIAPDMVSENNGVLLNGFGSADILAAMHAMVATPADVWLAMSRNCIDISKEHDWDSRIRQFEQQICSG